MPIDEKPSRNEDEYFAKREAELLKRRRADLDAERGSRERAAHLNKCPRCGRDLVEREMHQVKVDVCEPCGGLWLDRGELELLQEMQKSRGGASFLYEWFGVRR